MHKTYEAIKKIAINNKSLWIPTNLYQIDGKNYFVDGIIVNRKAVVVVDIFPTKDYVLGDLEQKDWVEIHKKQVTIFEKLNLHKAALIKEIENIVNYEVAVLHLYIYGDQTVNFGVKTSSGNVFKIPESNFSKFLMQEVMAKREAKLNDVKVEIIKDQIEKHITTKVKDYGKFFIKKF
ncbi:hypothetical protein ACW95P_04050 [Candidatus Mycoplasma pogonae]